MPPIVVVCSVCAWVCVCVLWHWVYTYAHTCLSPAPCTHLATAPQHVCPARASVLPLASKRRLRHLSNCSILILHFCLVCCFKRIWFSFCPCFCLFPPPLCPWHLSNQAREMLNISPMSLETYWFSCLCLSFVAPCVSWVAHIAFWQAGKFTNQFLYVRTLLTFPGPIAITEEGGGEGRAGYASCSYPSRPSRLLHYPVTFVVRVAN